MNVLLGYYPMILGNAIKPVSPYDLPNLQSVPNKCKRMIMVFCYVKIYF